MAAHDPSTVFKEKQQKKGTEETCTELYVRACADFLIQ